MRIKLDENLGRSSAVPLRAAGHDVATVPEDLCGAPDDSLLAACRAEGRCLVTLDLDFANPVAFPPADEAGLVVLRLPGAPTPVAIAEAVRTLAEGLETADVSGRLWVVSRGDIREYDPSA